jgi:carboxylesterase type B
MPPRNPNAPSQEGVFEGNEKPEVSAEETPDQLKARIAQLEAALAKSDAAKLIAEDEAGRLQTQAQAALLTTNVTERFAGKTDDGDDLWWYRIDLAPCGGLDIRINGQQYVHGETYKFSTDLLRSVKEIVSRTWAHENSINGANENPYKQAQNRILGGKAAPSWAYR